MRRWLSAMLAASLAATLAIPAVQALAAENDGLPAAAVDSAQAADASPEEAAAQDEVSPLLVTEVVTDSPAGGHYTYAEVYNNSDEPINFKDYTYYYCYEGGMGTGKVFSSSDKTNDFDYGSGDSDVIIQPGKTLVLWMGGANNETSLEDFNRTYGTSLVEGKDIIRTPYSGIHNTAKRGYFFGTSPDSVMVHAWSNQDGDDIPKGNPDKVGIQYTYPGTGRECVKSSVSAATPGSVSSDQVPAERVHVVDTAASFATQPTADGSDGLKVTAEVPYQGTSATTFVNLHYKQHYGDNTTEEKTVALAPTGDGKTFTATVAGDELFGDSVEWYVTAQGPIGDEVRSDATTTQITPVVPAADKAAPYYVTEVEANPQASDGKQYTYFEVYNASDTEINLSYFKIFYYYGFPDQTAAQYGKVWTIDNFKGVIEPGKTMVFYLSSNGTTVDDFNNFYGTDLVEGEDIVRVNYAGLHSRAARWISFGTSEDDAFTVARFNGSASETTDATHALQFSYPHGSGERAAIGAAGLTTPNASIPVELSKPTPGSVYDWQKSPVTATFDGYPGYPADDGEKPTLAVDPVENKDGKVPESINEGDELKVMYDTDLLLGATSQGRLDAFKDDVDPSNPTNQPGGMEALKKRPYLIGTEVLYKLDDDTQWTSFDEKTQWRLGHYLMQIPSDVLFGHSQVTFKVRAYTLYGVSETPEQTVTINRLNDTDGMRLNVQDGDVVSGSTTITANDGTDNAETKLSVDGQPQDVEKTLEDGAYFMIRTQGMDSYFKDAVTAPYGDNPRDILAIMNSWLETPDSRAIHVDNKYFTYNADTNTYDVTLTVWAGDSGTPFEEIYDVVAKENHEDFTVSGLQLRLANGKSYLPTTISPDNENTNTDTSLDATHKVGDSAGQVPHLEATFSIPADDATAMGIQLDTTKLSDGMHTIEATGKNGTASATVTVDNTAPTIDLGIADGEPLYEEVALDEATLASDANGIGDVALSLDGEPLSLPATISPRALAAGEHTLKAVVTDEAGNLATSEVSFTTVDADPNATVDTDTDGDGVSSTSAKLTVNVGSEAADVSFRQGRSLTTDNGGIVAAGLTASSEDGSYPAQFFRVNAGEVGKGDDLALSWKGVASAADADHPIRMFAYNYATGAWDEAGTADDSGTINGSFSAADHVKDGVATVLVQQVTKGTAPTVALPDDSAFSGAATTAADATATPALSSWDGTGRPSSYDFAFAWETDTQYYSESFPYHYDNMNQWIVDNAQDWGIRYVLHTGDIVDDADMTGEWENADHSMKIFDDAGMPYGVLGGNHDVYAGQEGYGNYWKYFGEDRFADKPYYGGSYNNNLCHYDLLSENGQDFIVLYASWDIYTEELDWMNQVLAQYPDRKAIIALHRYTNVQPADNLLDYTGKLIQDQVVAKNPNVFAVLNGHYHGASIQTDSFDDNGDGAMDRTVYQICTDYQSDPEGGSEYIKFLYFDLANNKVYVNSYSPYRNDFNYFDNAKLGSYGPGTHATSMDIAELDVPFNSVQGKTLTTSSVSADVQTDEQIGTVEGVTGDATYTWEGLTPGTTYGWYAEVTNDRGGLTRTPVQVFTTEAAGTTGGQGGNGNQGGQGNGNGQAGSNGQTGDNGQGDVTNTAGSTSNGGSGGSGSSKGGPIPNTGDTGNQAVLFAAALGGAALVARVAVSHASRRDRDEK